MGIASNFGLFSFVMSDLPSIWRTPINVNKRCQMKRNQYDESFKSEAVKLALSGELSYAEIARDLGVNYGTLTNWIYATMSNTKPDKPNNTAKPSKQDYQALERQNRALLKELEIRKKEIEFLKKASAYFASLK